MSHHHRRRQREDEDNNAQRARSGSRPRNNSNRQRSQSRERQDNHHHHHHSSSSHHHNADVILTSTSQIRDRLFAYQEPKNSNKDHLIELQVIVHVVAHFFSGKVTQHQLDLLRRFFNGERNIVMVSQVFNSLKGDMVKRKIELANLAAAAALELQQQEEDEQQEKHKHRHSHEHHHHYHHGPVTPQVAPPLEPEFFHHITDFCEKHFGRDDLPDELLTRDESTGLVRLMIDDCLEFMGCKKMQWPLR